MYALQLDFFKTEQECKVDELEKEIARLRTSLDKQRKSQFAKIGEQNKKIIDLQSRLDILEENICKGQLNEK